MAVYVDDMNAKFGRMIMCHMLADSTEELLDMADKIGVARKWIQKPGTPSEHFDVCKSAKAKAIANGAKQITLREAGQMRRERRRALVQHGVNCKKVEHLGGGYLHGEDDDTPHFVDNARYCGRCHTAI